MIFYNNTSAEDYTDFICKKCKKSYDYLYFENAILLCDKCYSTLISNIEYKNINEDIKKEELQIKNWQDKLKKDIIQRDIIVEKFLKE